MKWLPIDRDENGFATEECLNEMFTRLPIVVTQKSSDFILYEAICDLTCAYGWRIDIKRHSYYTHYLPIPKLEQ